MSDSKLHRKFASSVVKDLPRSGIRDFFDIVAATPDIISLGVGEPGLSTPWHIRDSTIFALEKGPLGYTANLGLKTLREAIAKYVRQQFAIDYDPDSEILVTTGVSEGLDLAIRAVTDPGDEILFHEPCYVSYEPVIRLAQGTPVALQTRSRNQFRLEPEAVQSRISSRSKALILNYPNNPTGAVMSRRELEEIAQIAIRHDLLVISDEIYAELTYDGQHCSIASLDGMKERTLFLHGFSKAWAMTGFRIGYCCGPAGLIEALMTIHQYTMLCAPTLSQKAAIEALKQAPADVERMRSEYSRHRNFFAAALAEMDIPCVPPRGAFYAFADIRRFGMSSQEFAMALLKEERVAVVPGTAFGKCGEGFVRCSFATSFAALKEAVRRMSRFVAGLRERHRQQTPTY